MPSLPSRDCSPNSPAKIVIFQTNAQFVDFFLRYIHLSFSFLSRLLLPFLRNEALQRREAAQQPRQTKRARPNLSHSAGWLW